MNINNISNIVSKLSNSDLLLEVGGGTEFLNRADHVIDILSYEECKVSLSEVDLSNKRCTPENWMKLDVCDRHAWPYKDKSFDYVVCSHLLEDVRDPLWVCSEMMRVGKAGYIEVPSRYVEQSRGVENPSYCGYYHHRWLVTEENGSLLFRHKPHSLHSIKDAVVADVGVSKMINPDKSIIAFEWKEGFESKEMLEFDEDEVNNELRSFALKARGEPDLLVSANRPLIDKLKKWWYYQRLRWQC